MASSGRYNALLNNCSLRAYAALQSRKNRESIKRRKEETCGSLSYPHISQLGGESERLEGAGPSEISRFDVALFSVGATPLHEGCKQKED